MSEVGIICIVIAVLLFWVMLVSITGFTARIEMLEGKLDKQREKKKDRGAFIEYTAKCKDGKELSIAIPLSDILEVFEYEDGDTAIVRYYKQTFKGKIPGGDVAKERYEVIMQRIRAAESETIFSDIISEDKEQRNEKDEK